MPEFQKCYLLSSSLCHMEVLKHHNVMSDSLWIVVLKQTNNRQTKTNQTGQDFRRDPYKQPSSQTDSSQECSCSLVFLELLFPHLSWKSKIQTYSVTGHFSRSLFLSLPDLAKFPIRLVLEPQPLPAGLSLHLAFSITLVAGPLPFPPLHLPVQQGSRPQCALLFFSLSMWRSVGDRLPDMRCFLFLPHQWSWH